MSNSKSKGAARRSTTRTTTGIPHSTMTFTASLTASFQNFGIQRPAQSHTHTLFLEYPATRLIPQAAGLCLRMEPPKSAAYRSRPDRTRFFLDDFGLEYFVRFPIAPACEPSATSDSRLPIINRVLHLALYGGQSTLEVVTVTHEDSGEAGYLVRLTSSSCSSPSNGIWECAFSQDDWRELLSAKEAKAWSSLLDDLIFRKSDRAYFHVQQRLELAETPSIEALRWANTLPATANEILALSMREIIDTPRMLRLEPIRYLHLGNDKILKASLPCEHETQISSKLSLHYHRRNVWMHNVRLAKS